MKHSLFVFCALAAFTNSYGMEESFSTTPPKAIIRPKENEGYLYNWKSPSETRGFMDSLARKVSKTFSPEVQKEMVGIPPGKEGKLTKDIFTKVHASIGAKNLIDSTLKKQYEERISFVTTFTLEYIEKLNAFNTTADACLHENDYFDAHEAIKDSSFLWNTAQCVMSTFIAKQFSAALEEAKSKLYELLYLQSKCDALKKQLNDQDELFLGGDRIEALNGSKSKAE